MGHSATKWLRPFVPAGLLLAAVVIVALWAILGPLPASARSSQALPASAPETCSDTAVRWLEKHQPAWFGEDLGKFEGFHMHAWCGAFARLGVMLVPIPNGGSGSSMEKGAALFPCGMGGSSGWLKVFRKTAQGWQKLQSDIESDDVGDTELGANGDILVNVNCFSGMLEPWHWDGRQFLPAGDLWSFSYSNGTEFIEKTLSPGQDFGAPGSTCTLRQAMQALGGRASVKKLICHDFTGHGGTDMAIYTLDGPWSVFRSTGRGWQNVTPHISPATQGSDLYYRGLIPEGNDGFLLQDSLVNVPSYPPAVRFHWDGAKFVPAR